MELQEKLQPLVEQHWKYQFKRSLALIFIPSHFAMTKGSLEGLHKPLSLHQGPYVALQYFLRPQWGNACRRTASSRRWLGGRHDRTLGRIFIMLALPTRQCNVIQYYFSEHALLLFCEENEGVFDESISPEQQWYYIMIMSDWRTMTAGPSENLKKMASAWSLL